MKDLQEDNLFGSMRERLGRYEESPSEELWNKIASKQKKDKVWPMFLEPIGLVLVGVVLLFGGEAAKTEEVRREEAKIEERASAKNEVIQSPITNHESLIPNHKSQITNLQSPIPNPHPISKTQDQVVTNAPSAPSTQHPAPPIDSVEVASPILPTKDSSIADEVVPPFKKPRSRYQIYFSATPSLSFQRMFPAANDEVIVQGFEPRSPLSIKRFGISIDAGLQREINKIFGVYAGLSFYHQKQELTYNYYNKDATVERVGDSWTFDITRKQQSKTFNYNMTNLGVSAGMQVTFKGEKLKHKFGAGLAYTHSLNSSNSYLAYQLSYRNELKINDRFSWFIEPVFTYAFISKENLAEPFKLKPYRAGIGSGLLYRF